MGTLAAFASSIAGGFTAFRGINVFDCQSVSFSEKFTTCYPHTDFGMMTGEVAGIGLVLAGAAMFIFGLIRLATIR